jgi:methyl-accepting chemotaxis protein
MILISPVRIYPEEGEIFMSAKKFKRKILNLSVERPLQIRLIMKILLISFLSILIVGGGFYFYTDQKIGSTYQMAHIKMSTFRDYLFPVILVFVAIAAFITSLLAIFLPGRIAGPIYRTKKEMKRLGEGDLRASLAFRPGDELKDLATSFNLMVEALKSKLGPLEKQVEEVLAISEKQSRLAEEGKIPDLRENVRIQLKAGEKLKEILNQFKWKNEKER